MPVVSNDQFYLNNTYISKNNMDVNEHERLSNITLRPRRLRGRDRMIVGFKSTYVISSYHHYGIESRLV